MERKECIEELKSDKELFEIIMDGYRKTNNSSLKPIEAWNRKLQMTAYSISVLERVDEGKIAKICSEYEYKIREDAKKWATDSLKGLDKNIEGETDNSFLVGRLYADILAHAIVEYILKDSI